jgi:hypothetical protein
MAKKSSVDRLNSFLRGELSAVETYARGIKVDARSDLEGDANIAQDDCESAGIPCPEEDRRTPACEVQVPGAIRVCELFDRPLVLLLVHEGGDCGSQEDVFEASTGASVTRCFLAIDVLAYRRSSPSAPVDPPGGPRPRRRPLNLYRIGGCRPCLPLPGGIAGRRRSAELPALIPGRGADRGLESAPRNCRPCPRKARAARPARRRSRGGAAGDGRPLQASWSTRCWQSSGPLEPRDHLEVGSALARRSRAPAD